MGIHKLWPTIAEAGEQVSYQSFTLREAARKMTLDRRERVIFGLDLSALMCECTAAVLAAGIHNQFQGGPIKIFFDKLCKLRKGAADIVFVGDGDSRPGIKRGTRVSNRQPWWLTQAVEVIEMLGFCYHIAPGEAEAELARMNIEGLIDGVISSDCDTAVFGAPVILRLLPSANQTVYNDQMTLYTSETIEGMSSLTSGGLLLYALLAGGDYGKGVSGCGSATAFGLAQCGIGNELLDAVARREDHSVYGPYLCSRICNELRTNSQKKMRTCRPSLADDFPTDFPDTEILSLYLNPTTSWSPGGNVPSSDNWKFKFRIPSIANIATFCYSNFGWRTESALKKNLRSHLWEAVFMQMLFSPFLLYDPTTMTLATPDAKVKVITARQVTRKGQFAELGCQTRLTISVKNFVDLMKRNFVTYDSQPFKVWVPANLLPEGVPTGIKKKSKITFKNKGSGSNFSNKKRKHTDSNAEAGPSTTLEHDMSTFVDVNFNGTDNVILPMDETHISTYQSESGMSEEHNGGPGPSSLANRQKSEVVEHSPPAAGPSTYLDLTRDTVSRSLSLIEQDGFIDLTRDDSPGPPQNG